jgi:hypothetical protein
VKKLLQKRIGPVPVWVAVVVVVLAGLYFYRKRKSGGSTEQSTADATGGLPFTSPEGYPLASPQGAPPAPVYNEGNFQPAADPHTLSLSNYLRGGKLLVPGPGNAPFSLRELARLLLPASMQNDPGAVEAELRRLVAANPSLRGKTTAPGGHLLTIPPGPTQLPTTYTHYSNTPYSPTNIRPSTFTRPIIDYNTVTGARTGG